MADLIARIMQTIESSTDPKKLRQIGINARGKGELAVARAADLRLYAILPAEEPGALEYDVWQNIHALEGSLSNERGKTTRLARTRQKADAVDHARNLLDLFRAVLACVRRCELEVARLQHFDVRMIAKVGHWGCSSK